MTRRVAKLRRAGVLAIVGILAAASPAPAQQSPLPSLVGTLFMQSIAPGLTLPLYLDQRRAEFRGFDVDHDGVLTGADRDLLRQRMAAGMRAHLIAQIMQTDLDGDGLVTRDEVTKVATAGAAGSPMPLEGEAQRRKRIDDAVAERMKLDANHDGVIDAAEMLADAKQRTAARGETFIDAVLTIGTDGRTTPAQYVAAAERFFRAFDANGDGVISREEIEAYRQRAAPRPAAAAGPARPPDPRQMRETECVMPPVAAGAKVVLVGTSGGTGVATVALGSQDVVTSAARVTIEDGAEPLYVVLVSSAPTIWQFDGAVGRVVRAYLVSNHASSPTPLPGIASGATGLTREVVTLAARPDCIKSFTDRPTIDATVAVGAVKRRAAHEPDAIVALRRAEHVWLPSGRHERSGEELPRDMKVMHIARTTAPLTVAGVRAEFDEQFPAGVVRIDRAAVIAGQPVESYTVLPSRAGLLQLLEEGKLAPGRGQEFIVRDKIRYPAGLGGTYRFRIPEGVAMPDGNAGAACVIAEGGNRPPTRSCN